MVCDALADFLWMHVREAIEGRSERVRRSTDMARTGRGRSCRASGSTVVVLLVSGPHSAFLGRDSRATGGARPQHAHYGYIFQMNGTDARIQCHYRAVG